MTDVSQTLEGLSVGENQTRSMAARPRVLLIGRPDARTLAITGALRRSCDVALLDETDGQQLLSGPDLADVVVLVAGATETTLSPHLRTNLKRWRVPVLLIGPGRPPLARGTPAWLWDAAPADATPEEILGRACTLARMARQARRLHAKIRRLRSVGRHLQCNYEEMDNELLLAGQLQRDFLPKRLPEVPGLTFVALMRPYSWVSGDIYDVFRVDEDHVALYVADAVGHGVAAGLLTMFIKQAIVPKRVTGTSYNILSPAEVLHDLNQSMVVHNLPNCQYVTICYCLINFRTLRMQVARAAHPAPLVLEPDATLRRIECDAGCVAGVFPEQVYSQVEVDLKPGQLLVVYSDGLDEAFGREKGRLGRWQKTLMRNAGQDVHTVFGKLHKTIDRASGSLHPEDDITAVGVQITNPA